MKKYLALLLALVMCFALVACGGGEPEAPADDTPVDEPAEPVDGGEVSYADVFTVAYAGLTQAGESVIFVMDDEPTFGALVIADTENVASASFVGEMTAVQTETGFGYTITDETSGLELTFDCIDNGDGTINLDCGNLGLMTIESCDLSQAIAALGVIDSMFAPVA